MKHADRTRVRRLEAKLPEPAPMFGGYSWNGKVARTTTGEEFPSAEAAESWLTERGVKHIFELAYVGEGVNDGE